MANSRNKKARKRNSASYRHSQAVRAVKMDNGIENKEYKKDFFDYESKLAGTPQRFGDTHPYRTYSVMDKDYDLLDDIYHKNGIAKKVVSKPAEDATRNGWRIVIPDDSDKQAAYQAALESLNLEQAFSQEIIYQRLHGDGYLGLIIDEANLNKSASVPVDTSAINNLVGVNAFGQSNVEEVQVNTNPLSPDYLKETGLIIKQTHAGTQINKDGTTTEKVDPPKPLVIDKSRYFHISNDMLENDNTGTSVLTTCYDAIKILDTAAYSAGKLLYALDINVYFSDGQIVDDDLPESQVAFENKQRQMSEGMSTDSLLMLNSTDRFERLAANVSGFDQLVAFAWRTLATASNIPQSVLTGEQSGTLAGATQDVANYYDYIKSIQKQIIKPQLKQIIKLLMWSSDVAGGSEDPDKLDWHIDFNPLWSADDKTQAQTTLTYAQAGSTLVGAGIYDSDQAKQFIDGQANNELQAMQNVKRDNKKEKQEPIPREVVQKYLNHEKQAQKEVAGNEKK